MIKAAGKILRVYNLDRIKELFRAFEGNVWNNTGGQATVLFLLAINFIEKDRFIVSSKKKP